MSFASGPSDPKSLNNKNPKRLKTRNTHFTKKKAKTRNILYNRLFLGALERGRKYFLIFEFKKRVLQKPATCQLFIAFTAKRRWPPFLCVKAMSEEGH